MKTMKQGTKVVRVSDEEAEVKKKEGWKFCPKSEVKKKRPIS